MDSPENKKGSAVFKTSSGLEAAVVPAKAGSIVIIGDSARSIKRTVTLLKST